MGTHLVGIGGSENSGKEGFKKGKIFNFIKFNQCVNSSQDDLVKGICKVNA